MSTWRQAVATVAAQHETAILVTVAGIIGSSPRDTGAKMVVTRDQLHDTIGGGHLEWRAIDIARAMLQQAPETLAAQRRLERFPLGASLGQCCGGLIHLSFERLDSRSTDSAASLAQQWRTQQDCWRLVPLDSCAPALVCARDGHLLADPANRANPAAAADATDAVQRGSVFAFDADAGCHVISDAQGKRWLVDPCLAERAHLYLFGAGHVGTALIRLLAELPCRVTWIDEREHLFPAVPPLNVTLEATDTPQAIIAGAPPDSCFLVMTHSHPLDQDLTERIVRRGDARWVGLIGSSSKRAQFERRLRRRGVSDQQLAQIICPIGIPDIPGKEPAVIAIGVAAQLLQVWRRDELAASADNPLHAAR